MRGSSNGLSGDTDRKQEGLRKMARNIYMSVPDLSGHLLPPSSG